MNNDDHLAKLQERLDTITSGGGIDENEPLMPFESAYTLTKLQEDSLIEHALQRLEELKSESGMDVATGDDWWGEGYKNAQDSSNGSPERTFQGKRKLYSLMYENEMDWRSTIVGGIFSESNFVIPMARRICRQMIARANNYFFGSDPWFAAYPVGPSDKELATKAMKFAQHKSKRSGARAVHETANEKAFVLGEAVTKSTHITKEVNYKKFQTILVDPSGNEILGQDQDYITEDDLWVESTSEDGTQSLGMVLKRDGITPQPSSLNYERRLVERRMRQSHAPDQHVLDVSDFLCPLNAKSIHDADVCVHLYDMPIMDIADLWAKRGAIDLSASQNSDLTKKASHILQAMASSAGQGESSTSRGKEELGESSDVLNLTGSQNVEVAEFYLRYDADGDGLLEEIMLVVDIKNRIPIYYEYLANVTPDGRRPFEVTRINPVHNRWHGLGAMEMFESTQEVVDLMVNRWNHAQTKEARVDFWDPSKTLEGSANPNLTLNWGKTYTLKPGAIAEEALQSVYLRDIKSDQLQQLMEFFLQMAMNESGVQHANDNFVAGMDSTKLATGIRNIEKTGQEMFSVYISHLEPGHTANLQAFTNLLFANIDPEEVITYFEDDAPEELLEISGDEVMDIELNVQILLTRQRGEEILESSMRAKELVLEFYSLSPEARYKSASMFRDMLRALNIPNVDGVIDGEIEIPSIDNPQSSMSPGDMAAGARSPERSVSPKI